MTNSTTAAALATLRECRTNLTTAHANALDAAGQLFGARAIRANDLGELIANAIAYAERLAFVAEGDLRADL